MVSPKTPHLPLEAPASDKNNLNGNVHVKEGVPCVKFDRNPTVRTEEKKHVHFKLHAINFEVTHVTEAANPVRFTRELLLNLRTVDPHAVIMHHKSAADPLTDFPLSSVTDIPHSPSDARTFIKSYLENLLTSGYTMTGKVIIRSAAKFSTLMQKQEIRKWLHGSPTQPRIQLDQITTQTSGIKSVPAATHVGLLMHVIPRFDTALILHNHIVSKLCPDAPQFRLESKTMFRNKQKTQVYSVVTNGNAKSLSEAFLRIFPKPSGSIFFLPNYAWNSFPASKKADYFCRQRQYLQDHHALIFKGVKDSSVLIPSERITHSQHDSDATVHHIHTTTGVKEHLSVSEWLRQIPSSGENPLLFTDVSDSFCGQIVLWVETPQLAEARCWLSHGLIDMAKLVSLSEFPLLFVLPDRIEQQLLRAQSSAARYLPFFGLEEEVEQLAPQPQFYSSDASCSTCSSLLVDSTAEEQIACRQCLIDNCSHDDATHVLSNTCAANAQRSTSGVPGDSPNTQFSKSGETILSLKLEIFALRGVLTEFISKFQGFTGTRTHATTSSQVSVLPVEDCMHNLPTRRVTDTPRTPKSWKRTRLRPIAPSFKPLDCSVSPASQEGRSTRTESSPPPVILYAVTTKKAKDPTDSMNAAAPSPMHSTAKLTTSDPISLRWPTLNNTKSPPVVEDDSTSPSEVFGSPLGAKAARSQAAWKRARALAFARKQALSESASAASLR